MKRISWTIIAALVATLFLPVNAAQALSSGQLTCVKNQVILEGRIAVATDSQGNIYEADGNLVRKVDATTGDTTIVAGTGEAGFSGDGGLAINAKLKSPTGLAVSGTTLYIADRGNGKIRKVNLVTGIISTFSTVGSISLRSVAVYGEIVYASGDGAVIELDSSGTRTQMFGNPWIESQTSMVVDSIGNVYYISDMKVKKISPTGVITTFAGSDEGGNTGDGGLATAATFDSIDAIAIDSSNNIYLSSVSGELIRKINASDGKISTFVTGVKAVTLAMVNSGTMVFGEFYSTFDENTGQNIQQFGIIKTINLQTKAISKLTGGSPYLYQLPASGEGGLLKNANLPLQITGFYIDPSTNDFYLSNWRYQSIQKVSGSTGILSIYAGNHPRNLGSKLGAANEVNIFLPTQVAKGPDGNIYYGDQEERLYKIDKTSKIVTKFAGGGQGTTEGGLAVDASLGWSRSIAFDSFGNLYTADSTKRQIKKITSNGQIFTIAGTGVAGYTGDGGPATAARLDSPNAIVIDSQDNLYFADQGDSTEGVIRKINLRATTPTITTVAGKGSNTGFAFNGLATDAKLSYLNGNMALGPDGKLYWVEVFEGQKALRSLDLSTGPNAGKISTELFNTGEAFAFDKDGKLLLAERGSIFKFDKTTNTISLVAGSPGATTIGGSLVTNLKVGCNLVPQVSISVGSTPNSQVATIPDGQTRALIPATAALPAITLDFGGTSPSAVTVAPVASNPAAPASTPFKILGSTKIVNITPTGTFTGSATVCLDGASTDSIFHFTGGQWVELPSRTYVNGQVCGVTTSFSPFAAAEAQAITAPVVAYVPPTPVPYLKTLSTPQIRLSGDKLMCTAGTYNSGYTLDGVIQGSATALYTPVSYTYNILFNQLAQSSLAVTTTKNSATWSLSTAPAGTLVSCSVTVTANSLKNSDSSMANPASVSAALTTQSQSTFAAESAYNAVISANSKSYQKALLDNRAAWRANVDKVKTAYLAELTRINGLPVSKASRALKSAALKTYLAAQKKTAVDYKASGPAALAVRDLANKEALDFKKASIMKANSIYGAFIESIGYGVLIP